MAKRSRKPRLRLDRPGSVFICKHCGQVVPDLAPGAEGQTHCPSCGWRLRVEPLAGDSALAVKGSIEDRFEPSFTGTLQEHEWIIDSLGGFYADKLLTDVLYRVKGGKEATVYCCRAHPSTGLKLLAAKVFRPRKFRAMRNDAIYKEGRGVLDGSGNVVRDSRSLRALRKKTRYGHQIEITSWSQHEYKALCDFHEAGADVPWPLASGRNTILMEYVGDEAGGAPTLQQAALDPAEAPALFERLIGNVRLFLSCDRVHADLSAHNVLYWKGKVEVIDFPQVVDAYANPSTFFLLARDIERLCQHFARYGVRASPSALADELWTQFRHAELTGGHA